MNSTTLVIETLKRFGRQFTKRERARTRIAARHLSGSGLEIGALHKPLRTTAHVRYVDRLSRTGLRKEYPELAGLPLVDADIVDDGEKLTTIAGDSQDFIIASHFIEHCQDPIGTLVTFMSKVKRGGIIYIAVPDKRDCFDRNRPSTTFEHLEADHQDGGKRSRVDHYREFARLAHYQGGASEEDVEALAAEQMSGEFSIHFHVWTFEEFDEFLANVKRTYLPDLVIVDRQRNFDEGIFILQRSGS